MIIRHEINIICGTLTGSAAADGSWVVQLDTSQYSGTCTYYFEALYSGAASNTGTVRLRRKGTTTDDATLTGATSSTLILTRSSSFTPPAGQTEYIVRNNADGTRSQTIKAARILIIQDTGSNPLTSSESQYEIGNTETAVSVTSTNTLQPQAAPKYWKYNAANFDGTCTFYAEATYLVSSTTGNKTIVIQESSDLSIWTTVSTLLSAASGSTTTTRLRGSSFTPVDGRYYRLAWTNSSSMTTVSIYNAKIIVDQIGTGITKLEEQYLLANTTLSAGTALQNFLTKWDSAEWSGVTNVYTHQVNAGASNTSVIEIDTSVGTQLSGSVVNSPNNYEINYNDSYYTSLWSTSLNVGATSYNAVSQSFTARSGNLNAISFWASKNGSPTGDCVAKLYSHTGTYGTGSLPGTLLATSDVIDASNITATVGTTNKTRFVFSGANQITLSAGTNYCVVFEFTNGNSTDFIKLSIIATGSHSGNSATRAISTGIWSTSPSNNDIHFAVEAGGITMPSSVKEDLQFGTSSGGDYSITGSTTTGFDVKSGQTFTPSSTFSLYSIKLKINKTGTPTDDVVLKLLSGIDGSVLAISTLPTASIDGSYEEFVFISPYTVQSGIEYFIELSRSGDPDTSNYFTVFTCPSGTSLYTGTFYRYYLDGTLAWRSETRDIPMFLNIWQSNLDVKATTNSGSIFSSRIISIVAKSSVSPIIGSATGTATVSGTLTNASAAGAMTGSSAATGTISATIAGAALAIATAASIASFSGTAKGSGAIQGSSSSVASVSAIIGATGSIAGTSSSISSISATLKGAAALISTIPNTGSFTGTVVGSGSMVAAAASVASVSGIYTAYRMGTASVAATGSISGTLLATEQAASTITSVGTFSGTISSSGTLIGATAATGTVSGNLTGSGKLSDDISAAALVSGILSGSGQVISTVAALASVSGTGTRTRFGASSVSGLANFSGTLSGGSSLQAQASGIASISATLSGSGNMIGSVPVIGLLSGQIFGSGFSAAIIAGDGVITAILQAGGSMQSTTSSVSAFNGVITGIASIAADTTSVSDLSATLKGVAATASDLQATAAVSGNIVAGTGLFATISAAGSVNATISGTGALISALNATGGITALLEGSVPAIASIGSIGALSATLSGTESSGAAIASSCLFSGTLKANGDVTSIISSTVAVGGNLEVAAASGMIAVVSTAATATGLLIGDAALYSGINTAVSLSSILLGDAACLGGIDCSGILSGRAHDYHPYLKEILCLSSGNIQTELVLQSKIDNLVLDSAVQLSVLSQSLLSDSVISLESKKSDASITMISQTNSVILLSSIIKSDHDECI